MTQPEPADLDVEAAATSEDKKAVPVCLGLPTSGSLVLHGVLIIIDFCARVPHAHMRSRDRRAAAGPTRGQGC